ncbi:MAG TPA: hypothetical protein VMI06_13520 [Terriglobia bacterium]|nr:hypothetical protein [Terriglobia bacterium]
MKSIVRIVVATLLLLGQLAFSQARPKTSSTALSYAAKAVAAMVGTNVITDATVVATVNTWMAGSTSDSGTATLKVEGYGESRIDTALATSGSLSEIRDASAGYPQGEFINAGKGTIYSQQICFTDADWFYPLYSAMTVAPNNGVILSYVGLETLNGASVQHLQSYNYNPSLDSASQSNLQTESTTDYYLDATTFLPVAEHFNTFSSRNVAIPIQVLFLSYSTVNGVTSPQHVQKYVNGTLQFDFTVTSITFNSGIPLSTFSIPQ